MNIILVFGSLAVVLVKSKQDYFICVMFQQQYIRNEKYLAASK